MPAVPKLDPREEHFRIASETDSLSLFLRYLGPAPPVTALKIVLYIHGATFPSALSIAHRFDGYSWRDDLNAAGYHVWGLDFLGFGGSDRYPEMSESSEGTPALGRAEVASRQIEKAVDFILKRHGADRLSLIAHSWGSMPAGLFAGRNPEQIDRIVFFAPIAQRRNQLSPKKFPGWRLVSVEEQWNRFVEDVPQGSPAVLSKRHFEEWGPMYLDTDELSRTHSPEGVKTPTGPVQEIAEAHAGQLAYDPGLIKAPAAIIRGEWDHLVTDDDARWLFGALKNSPIKRDIKISHATHLMHLERNRYALYREAQQFLDGGDQPSIGLRGKCAADRTGTSTDSTSGDKEMKESTLTYDTDQTQISGYDYGKAGSAHSPLSLEELRQLEQSVGWSEEDAQVLQRHGELFKTHAEKMVDSWRAVIGAQPHLAKWFFGPDGKPDDEYKAKVKKRFIQWVVDACFRPHDQTWLNYQEEIGLRHTPEKKNLTDGRQTPPLVPLRYLIGFIPVVTIGARKFFADAGIAGSELRRLEDAWTRAVQLHITLWSRPYAKDGLW
ncbi:MAG TPA: alpha/beta fold hydrolase [Terriglobales bacterium]|nr:alpha/beta fold hydrolase [Terriglobales bacterium]